MKLPAIDPEFAALCPPLSEDEAALLEQSIVRDGCRDPLSTWQGAILDGHHRFTICTKHGKPFEQREIALADRKAARMWVLENQIARRNLTAIQAALLRATYYESTLPKKDNAGRGRHTVNVGRKFGLSQTRIRTDVLLKEAVGKLSDNAKAFVVEPDRVIRQANIFDIAQLPHDLQDLAVGKVQDGSFGSLQEAMLSLRPPVKTNASTSPRRCKGCGGLLAHGVATCLKCDLTEGTVRKALNGQLTKVPLGGGHGGPRGRNGKPQDKALMLARKLRGLLAKIEVGEFGKELNDALTELGKMIRRKVARREAAC